MLYSARSREIANRLCECVLFVLLFDFCSFTILLYNTLLVKVVSYTLVCAACLRLLGLTSSKSPFEKRVILFLAIVGLYWGLIQSSIIVIIYSILAFTYAHYEENRLWEERRGYKLLEWDQEKGYGTIPESDTPQDNSIDMGGSLRKSLSVALFASLGIAQLILISPRTEYSVLGTGYATWTALIVQCIAGGALCLTYGTSHWDLDMFYMLGMVAPKIVYVSIETGDDPLSVIPASMSILTVWLIGNSVNTIMASKENQRVHD